MTVLVWLSLHLSGAWVHSSSCLTGVDNSTRHITKQNQLKIIEEDFRNKKKEESSVNYKNKNKNMTQQAM